MDLKVNFASNLRRGLFVLVIWVAALLSTSCASKDRNHFLTKSDSVSVTGGWEFRWGDSPRRSDLSFEWQFPDAADAAGWQATDLPSHLPGRGSNGIVWIKGRIPQYTLPEASVWLTGVDQNMEVFVDGKLIYKFGEIDAFGKGKFVGYPWHIIDLPQHSAGKPILFRVWSGHVNAGLFGEVLVGSRTTFIEKVFLDSINNFVVGAILVFMGLISLIFFVVKPTNREYLFFFLQTLLGVYIMSRTMMKFTIYPNPTFWIGVEFASLALGAAGILGFSEYMFGPTKWRHCLWLARLSLVVALIAILSAATNFIPIMSTLLPIQICGILAATFGTIATRNAFKNRAQGIWMIAAAFVFLAVASLLEIGIELRWFLTALAGRTTIFPWGQLMYLSCMGGLLVLRHHDINRKNAKLKGQLDKILRGTKEMAVIYEQFDVVSKASQYLVDEFVFGSKVTIEAALFEKAGDLSSGKLFQVYSGGEFAKHFKSENISSSEFECFSAAISSNHVIILNGNVVVPVSWGQDCLGVLRINGLDLKLLKDDGSHFIETLASSLALALANIKFLKESEQKARTDKELETAKAIQEALLPPSTSFPGLEFAASYFSAEQTGGDWYGYYYDRESHRLDVYVGDVTGHGIGPSLLTGVICGGVYSCEKTLTLTSAVGEKTFTPVERLNILAQVLNRIVAQTGKGHHLATMAFLSLDLRTGEVAFLNAGHNNPFVISANQGASRSIPNPGSRLGYATKPQFAVKSFSLEKNDIVFLYTDGLIENSGPDGKLLSPKRLKEILASSQDVGALQKSMSDECKRIWATNLQDDVTTLFVKWKGPCEEPELAKCEPNFPGVFPLQAI